MKGMLDVTLRLESVTCLDEGDGAGNAEPYLWAVFFKIDGDTVRVDKDGNFKGVATVRRTNGGHGNLGSTDVDAGEKVPVPATVGHFHTWLKPIPVEAPNVANLLKFKRWKGLPGMCGVISVLMEEDNVSDQGAFAGYDRLCFEIESKINAAIAQMSVEKLLQAQSDGGLAAVGQGVDEKTRESIKEAISDAQDFLEDFWAWLNQDDQIGSSLHTFRGDFLEEEPSATFDHDWDNEGHWLLHGSVSASPLILERRVTCVRSSERQGKNYRIWELGGVDSDDQPWNFSSREVMRMIEQGFTFYVEGASGRRSQVSIHYPVPPAEPANFKHLRTTADGDPGNNLSSLPQCPGLGHPS